MRDINLLPETLQKGQKESKRRLLVNSLSVILLVFASTILVILFSYRSHLSQNLQTFSKNQKQIENEIAEFRETEGLFRFVGLKVAAFSEELTKRKSYGIRIAKIREIFANSATLTKVSLSDKGEAHISGEVVSFPELAIKLVSLNKSLIFENFEIVSLGLSQEKGVVEFGIQAKFE